MTEKVTDFYEGAARALGFDGFDALSEAYWAEIDAELERRQAACSHLGRRPQSDMCMDCGKHWSAA